MLTSNSKSNFYGGLVEWDSKKIAKVLLSCVLACALLTACGGEQVVDKPGNNFSGDVVKIGVLTHLNSTEESFGDALANIEEETGATKPRHLPKFYDSLKLMQLGVESGEIDSISTYKSVADYIVATNNKFEIVQHDVLNKLRDSFCFAVRKDDTQLKAELDKVLDEIKADGTLDKLINDYITNVDKGQDPPKVEIPKFEGAQTIKVGVTGDLPPLDLILPDNSPAGFNTAMLAEIAKRLDRNIEIVQIETGARAAALSSKLIDVVFWVIVPFGNDNMPADIDKPEGLELSNPYFQDNVAQIKLKSDK